MGPPAEAFACTSGYPNVTLLTSARNELSGAVLVNSGELD